MSPQLEAALIAGAVSLVGVLISLFLARRNELATRRQSIFVKQLEADYEANTRIREYANEVQRLRAACWQYHKQVQALFYRTNLPREQEITDLEKLDLHTSFDPYWLKWADAKVDLLSRHGHDVIRQTRHDTSKLVTDIHMRARFLLDLCRKSPADPAVRRSAEFLQESIMRLIESLDRIFSLVISVHQHAPSEQVR